MAKSFLTGGRISRSIKRRQNYGINPIRPQYSEMGGAGGGSLSASGGSTSGAYVDGGFYDAGAQQNPQRGSTANNNPKNSDVVYSYRDSEQGGKSGGNGSDNAAPTGAYDAGSFEDYYSRLISALHSYGIDMALPTLDELYAQLSSFLRPSVDAAIAGRQKYGETVMAEMDADAYSRGMGSSTYLSSMKNREYDDIASDIAAMETNYNSTLAEYLYNASNELANVQTQFAAMYQQHELEMQRQLQQQAYENERLRRQQEFEAEQERLRQAYEMERLRRQQEFERAMREAAAASGGKGGTSSSGGKSSGGGRSSGSGKQTTPKSGKSGASSSGNESADANGSSYYYNYSVYLQTLSSSDRSNVFNNSSSYWTAIRDELRRNLTPSQYERLRAEYDPHHSGGRGGGGGRIVNTTVSIN